MQNHGPQNPNSGLHSCLMNYCIPAGVVRVWCKVTFTSMLFFFFQIKISWLLSSHLLWNTSLPLCWYTRNTFILLALNARRSACLSYQLTLGFKVRDKICFTLESETKTSILTCFHTRLGVPAHCEEEKDFMASYKNKKKGLYRLEENELKNCFFNYEIVGRKRMLTYLFFY